MLHRCGRAGGALLVSLALTSPLAAAPNAKDFDQRLTAIEQAMGAAGAGSGQSQAQLVIQLQQMQAELRQLRGMVEESANQVEQLQKRQREFYLDLDSRLSALEPGGGAAREPGPPANGDPAGQTPSPPTPPDAAAAPAPPAPSAPSAPTGEGSGAVERPIAPVAPQAPGAGQVPPVAAVAPAAPVDAGGEQAAYRAASDLLRMGRYEDAIAGFQGQLQSYPGGQLADNAQYWIGEAYYVTRQFDRALAEFQRVVSEYPQSPKAADALLKVGYIQYERRDFAAARQTLTNLKTTWPNTPAARLADNRLSRMKEEGV
ncbi:MAG: tol-pal system protein YbgF [Pseudomonadota bacterium]